MSKEVKSSIAFIESVLSLLIPARRAKLRDGHFLLHNLAHSY
jgi:hypothetical protein